MPSSTHTSTSLTSTPSNTPSTKYTMYLVGIASLSSIGLFGVYTWYNSSYYRRSHVSDDQFRRRELELESQLEADRQERSRLESELAALRRTVNDSLLEVNERRKAGAGHASEIERLGKRALEAEKEVEVVRRQNRSLSDRKTVQEKEMGGLESEVRRLRAELTKAQNEVKRVEGEVKRLKAENQKGKELLDVRTAELKGAQAFLTKADNLSGQDVIGLVEGLNAEMMQVAASMAEAFAIEEKKVNANGKELESDETREANSRTEDVVGPHMTEWLRVSEHQQDPILVQIALQTGMAAYAHWMISSWCYESPEDEHMRHTEEQAVSGRWRQLTRTHLKRMLAQEPDLLSDMAEALAHILVTAGYKASPAGAHQQIMQRFSEEIGRVTKLAQKLNTKIGEGVTSCDLEVLYISPDVPYEKLGLVRAERISGSMANWNESVLLKPRVILPSGLAGIAE